MFSGSFKLGEILQGSSLRQEVSNSKNLQEVPETNQIHQPINSNHKSVYMQKRLLSRSQTNIGPWKQQRSAELPRRNKDRLLDLSSHTEREGLWLLHWAPGFQLSRGYHPYCSELWWCSCLWDISTSISNPTKTHWFIKLDFGTIQTRKLSGCLGFWVPETPRLEEKGFWYRRKKGMWLYKGPPAAPPYWQGQHTEQGAEGKIVEFIV